MCFEAFAKAKISIHAPRVGSDADNALYTASEKSISIHAPRVGSDFIFSNRG